MSSQLNVDTIVDKAGSGGSNVKMANTSTYVSDGGAVTQNTVQGLAKFWMNYHSGTTINDSFNSTSLTDNGTGDYTMTIANDMANATYAVHHTSSDANTNASVIVPVIQGSSLTTTLFKVYLLNEDVGVSDGSDPNAVSVLGDLA